MALSVGEIEATLTLRDSFSSVLKEAASSLQSIGTKMQSAGVSLSSIGSSLLPVSAALAGGAAASLYFAGTFETSMTQLVSLAGVSQEQLEGVKQKILNLAPAVGIGPQALAEGMMKVSSTIADTDVAFAILEVAARGSAAGMGSVVDVAGALTAVVNSYGAENITAARAADILTQAVKDGGASAKELAPTLANVVPFAAALGISFEEVGANIATVTKLGVPAAEAVTQLSAVMTALTKESNEGSTALASVGLSYAGVRAEIREKGLAAALADLVTKFGGNTTALTEVFGRIEAVRNVMSISGAQAKTYATEIERITNSSGALNSAFEQMRGTQVQTWAELSASVQVIAIKFGDALAPALQSILNLVKPLLVYIAQAADVFTSLPAPVQLSALALLAVVAAIGPVLFIGGQLLSSLGLIAAAFGTGGIAAGVFGTAIGVLGTAATAAAGILLSWPALLIGIGAAVLTLTDSWKEFRDLIRAVGNVVKVFASNVIADLTAKMAAEWTELKNLIGGWRALESTLGSATPKQIAASKAMDDSRKATDQSRFALAKLGTTVNTETGFLKATFSGWATALENVALSMERLVPPTVQGTNGFRTLATAGLLPAKQNAFELQAELDTLAKQGLESVVTKSKAAQEASEKHAEALQALRDQITGAGLTQNLKDLEAVYATLTPAQLANKDITERLAEEVKKLGVPVTALSPALQAIVLPVQDITAGFAFLPGVIDPVIRNFNDIESSVIKAGPPLSVFGNVIGVTLPAEFVASKKTIDDWILSLEQVSNIPPPDPGPWARFSGQLTTNLDQLQGAFVQLAQTAEGSLGTVFEAIGTIIGSMKIATQGGGQLRGGLLALGDGNVANGIAGITSGVAAVTAAMDAATSSTSRWGNAIGGALTGMQAGNAIWPGWGALIGGVAGAIIGLTRNTNDYAAAQARANAILAAEKEALEKAAAALQRVLTAAENLAAVSEEDFAWLKVIAYNGSEGIEKLSAAIKTQLIGALNEAVAAGRPFSQSMLDAIANAKALGLATEELAAIVRQSQSNSITGLGQLIGAINISVGQTGAVGAAAAGAISTAVEAILASGAPINEVFAAIRGNIDQVIAQFLVLGKQEVFEKLTAEGANVAGVFAALTPVLGTTAEELKKTFETGDMKKFREELDKAMSSLTTGQLQDVFKRLGLEGSAAFGQIMAMANNAGNAISNNAVVAAQGAVRVIVSLQQQGRLTNTVFQSMTAQVFAAFQAMELQGQGGTQALRRIQPELQTIWELQKDFGMEVDEGTQLLLDQAVAAGIVGDTHRSEAAKTTLALERIVLLLETLVTATGTTLPGAITTGGAEATAAFANVGTAIEEGVIDPLAQSVAAAGTAAGQIAITMNNLNPQVNVGINYNYPAFNPPIPSSVSGPAPQSFASGSGGFQNFGRGTLAVLHGWEAVVPAAPTTSITGTSSSGSLGFSGGAPISGGRTVQQEIAQLRAEMERDRRDLARDRRDLPRQLAVAIQDALVLGGMRR